ncbi:MAG: sn-glycerol-1-phosphate dehydrogenase [Clostridiales bacterium]|nr:sn-glycerol-1-phosphate dehydrogenase [Clostridiales bacterium]
MNINVEYRHESGFKNFFNRITGKIVAVMYDVNTKPFAEQIKEEISRYAKEVLSIAYPDEELIPSEDKCQQAYDVAKNAEYVLAVGSGTLNDMAKSVSTRLNIECGVLATAASMDGYCSKGSALMRGGYKVTDEVHTPSDVLIDLEIVRKAPREMTAAGFGDIIGKYTCLTDWKMANIVNGEPINQEAFSLMEQARTACVEAFEGLTQYKADAIAKLMNALITAGTSMAICGNSRPASGSEHHQSHFLEMDFVRRGEKIPLHGVKVAIGTMVSITLYKFLKEEKIQFKGAEEVYKLADELPSVESIKTMLERMGCPVKFSQIGVRKETMVEMIEKAYTVRDRYTVLTLVHDLGLTERVKPLIMKEFY